ncbi:MAG: serine/threonine-protein phosphatase [Cyanobacteria bacterium]|nr:serine/threonine-protein phosphatase [Cyanobacteriota bacterium]
MTCIAVVSQPEPKGLSVDTAQDIQHALAIRPFLELLEKKGHDLQRLNLDHFEDSLKTLNPDALLFTGNGHCPEWLDMARELRQNPDFDTLPLVLLSTAHLLDPELNAFFEAGVCDCLILPDEPVATLYARLNVLLGFRRQLMQAFALNQQLNELNNDLDQRNRQVERELYVARQLQQSLLPVALESKKGATSETEETDLLETQFSKRHYESDRIKISGLYIPCDALGGDLYDVVTFEENKIGISVADVSGHGVPAGFITAIFKSSFYRITHTYEQPGQILYHLNNELLQIIKTGDYITAIYARLLEGERHLEYAGAGHPYPLWYHAETKTLSRLTENGAPLGWFNDMEYPTASIELAEGDKILFYTDGITELKNQSRELFGEERLEQLFLDTIERGTSRILDRFIETLSDFTEGHELEDDMSMVLIETR